MLRKISTLFIYSPCNKFVLGVHSIRVLAWILRVAVQCQIWGKGPIPLGGLGICPTRKIEAFLVRFLRFSADKSNVSIYLNDNVSFTLSKKKNRF